LWLDMETHSTKARAQCGIKHAHGNPNSIRREQLQTVVSTWAELPTEHIAHMAEHLGSPQDLCHTEVTCNAWCKTFRKTAEEQRIWLGLCSQWYPTMAARIATDGSNTTNSTSPSSSPLILPATPPATPYFSPSSPIMCPLTPVSEFRDGQQAAQQYEMQDVLAPQWRDIFQRRYLKQLEWDGRRRRKGLHTGSESGVPAHAARCRDCKRCGITFDPRDRNPVACHWHRGRFVAMDNDGVIVGGSSGRDFEKRAQNIIKTHNRKKSSKKANMVVFGAACETGVAREDGIAWRWSCCGEESLVAPGCATGAHS